MKKNELLETLGFVLEMATFITAGYYLAKGVWILFAAYAIIGTILARVVGDSIKRTALEEEYKK